MTFARKTMIEHLNRLFVPELRERGFKGSIPHFRRTFDDRIELLSVMFDKNGGAFLLEISTVFPNQRFTNLAFGNEKDFSKINTFSTNYRHRIKRDSNDVWFHYWDLYRIRRLFFSRPLVIAVNPDRSLEECFSKKAIEKKRIKKVFSAGPLVFRELAQEAVTCLDQAEDWWIAFRNKHKSVRPE